MRNSGLHLLGLS